MITNTGTSGYYYFFFNAIGAIDGQMLRYLLQFRITLSI